MRLPLTKLGDIALTITIALLTLSPLCLLLLLRLGGYIVNLCSFYSSGLIGKLTAFFAASGVQLVQSTSGLFHFRRAGFSSQLKSKVGSTLAYGHLHCELVCLLILQTHRETDHFLTTSGVQLAQFNRQLVYQLYWGFGLVV